MSTESVATKHLSEFLQNLLKLFQKCQTSCPGLIKLICLKFHQLQMSTSWLDHSKECFELTKQLPHSNFTRVQHNSTNDKQQMYRVCLRQQTLHTYHLWQQQAEEAYCQVKLLEELIQTLADSGHTCHCYKKTTDTLTFNKGRRKDEISYRRWNSNKHVCSIQNACKSPKYM